MKNRALVSENQVNYVEDIIFLKRHSKPWDFKEGGDTDHIRDWPGKVVCSSIESLGMPHLVEVADTFEKAWEGGCRSGNDYRIITDLCVTTVSLAHDD